MSVLPFRKSMFSIEDYGFDVAGWTDGQRWNGWAMPVFEFGQAHEVCRTFFFTYEYDSKTDTFIGNNGNDLEEYPGKDVETTEGTKHVYAIGAGCWVWWDNMWE